MRRCFQVVTIALLLGASPAAADRDVLREQSEQTVEVRGFKALEVINSRGRVDLTASPDAKLHVTALKIVRVGGRERAQKLARGIVVETGIRDDKYVVEVRYQKRHSIRINFWDLFKVDGVNLPRYEVRVTCQVPRGLPVTVRESSGDIRSEGLAGAQVLKSSSGDVTVTAVRQARVRSVSGDVVVRQAAGPLRASTTSGGITVTGAEDSLVLSSVSGDIRADRAPRGLDAETTSGEILVRGVSGAVKVGSTSGDLRLSLREPFRGLEASTTSGEIRLQLDPAIACALDMSTTSGTVEVEQPMQMKNVSRRSVSGTIRGGRTPVVLHTTSGDITVVGGGE